MAGSRRREVWLACRLRAALRFRGADQRAAPASRVYLRLPRQRAALQLPAHQPSQLDV